VITFIGIFNALWWKMRSLLASRRGEEVWEMRHKLYSKEEEWLVMFGEMAYVNLELATCWQVAACCRKEYVAGMRSRNCWCPPTPTICGPAVVERFWVVSSSGCFCT